MDTSRGENESPTWSGLNVPTRGLELCGWSPTSVASLTPRLGMLIKQLRSTKRHDLWLCCRTVIPTFNRRSMEILRMEVFTCARVFLNSLFSGINSSHLQKKGNPYIWVKQIYIYININPYGIELIFPSPTRICFFFGRSGLEVTPFEGYGHLSVAWTTPCYLPPKITHGKTGCNLFSMKEVRSSKLDLLMKKLCFSLFGG